MPGKFEAAEINSNDAIHDFGIREPWQIAGVLFLSLKILDDSLFVAGEYTTIRYSDI